MKRWAQIETEPIFLKTDMAEELILCEWLEGFAEDKETIYRLIYIPFNMENPDLLSIWQEYAKKVVDQGFVDIDALTNLLDYEREEAFTETDVNQKIHKLELLHQKYDLIHNFVRLFGKPDRREQDKQFLRGKKKEISRELTETLREKKLKRRKCSVCGRNLPFGYPYS